MVDNDWNNLSFDEKLNKLRQSIDDIDEKILDLLNQRAKVAQEVGKIKNHHDTDFYIPSREKAVMKRLREKSAGPLPREAIESVFREVI
ncbi:MAG: chorismate mutase, partial [Candidatus Hinthialibacter sp.]